VEISLGLSFLLLAQKQQVKRRHEIRWTSRLKNEQNEKRGGRDRPPNTLRAWLLVLLISKLPLKTLRGLCIQHSVLPPCAVERADFVQALAPLTGSEAPSRLCKPEQPAQPNTASPPEVRKRNFSQFLGVMKPNFTVADLVEMPVSTLKTLCIQHGVMPMEESREQFLEALYKLAKPPPPEHHGGE